MDTPARTIERLFTLAAVGSAFGAGFLLLESSNCNDSLDVAITCAESSSVDVGRVLLAIAALLGLVVTQAWFARSSNRSSWVSMIFDDRTEEEVRLDADSITDDVEDMGEGWAKLEERMLASRVEEE